MKPTGLIEETENNKDNSTNQKNNLQITGISKHLPIIILYVNSLSLPKRRQRLGDWIKNKTQLSLVAKKHYSWANRSKNKEKKYVSQLFNQMEVPNTNMAI